MDPIIGDRVSSPLIKKPSFKTQMAAMLWYRFLLTLRDKKFFILGLIMPMVSIILSIVFNSILTFKPAPETLTIMTPLAAGSNISLIPVNGAESLISNLTLPFHTSIYLDENELNNDVLNGTIENLQGGFGFQDNNGSFDTSLFITNVYFNTTDLLPSLFHSFFQALYKDLTNETFTIQETYHTLSSGVTVNVFAMVTPIIVQYGYVFVIPYFAILIVIDREKALIGWVVLCIAKIDGFYNNAASIFHFLAYGVSAIPFGFLLQFIFTKEETANKWLYPMVSLITATPSVIISVGFPNSTPLAVEMILCVLPTFSLYNGFSYLVKGNNNIGWVIMIELLSGIFFFIALLVIEKLLKPSVSLIEDIEQRRELSGDEDVINERYRIQEISQSPKQSAYNIIVNGVFKQFKENIPVLSSTKEQKIKIKHAVDGIWFGVERGECFGLLGQNGAGKTTLLNIMTGVLTADEGVGYLKGFSIKDEKELAFASVGSCPQFDILFDSLTVAEHLKFYSWIKGIPLSDIPNQIDYFINKFAISEHKNKNSKDLSGGTKRKLSVACSLIGGPSVVFMDEPSTGLDPASRRDLWGLINDMKTGKSFILTTHSMEEAEFLCNRIGIMVSGRLRCIGTPLHLKHKYGSGYHLDIVPVDMSRTNDIVDFVRSQFPDARLVERMGGIISFELPVEKLSFGRIFQEFERKKEQVGIYDFSISQTSLEKVFLKFAIEQANEDEKENIKVLPPKKSLFNFFKNF
eukprot:gene1181-1493_t